MGGDKKGKPILFSGPMVRAILDGRKSQTRRVLNPQPMIDSQGNLCAGKWNYGQNIDGSPCLWNPAFREKVVRYAPGDRLWVRESWQTGMGSDGPMISYKATPDFFEIDAWDGPDEGAGPSFNYDKCPGATWYTWLDDLIAGRDGGWRPSIHMPRWASRLTLTVTEVRVQRVQEISEADAVAEGLIAQEGDGGKPGPGFKWRGTGYHGGTMSDWGMCFHAPHFDGSPGCSCNVGGPSPAQCAFRELWDSLNGRRSGCAWSANPWVVALTFDVHVRNIDAMPED